MTKQDHVSQSGTPTGRPHMSRRRKACFAAFTVVLVLVVVEVVLTLAGVAPDVASEDPFVGFESRLPLFESTKDQAGQSIYRTALNKRTLFNDQQFPLHKRAGTYRIFCMGGSTTYGRPYRDSTSFVGWLRAFLQTAAPETNWEVINCGGISYASYRVAALMEELVKYEPDMFIIYSGHNEFLERRTYADLIDAHPVESEVQLLMHRSRTVSLIRRALSGIRDDMGASTKRKFLMAGEVSPILDYSGGLDLYKRDERFREQVIEHYRFNLKRMVSIARSVAASVVLVQPACNLLDFSPFKSQHRDGLGDEERRAWRDLYDRGAAAIRQSDYESALDYFDRAMRIDDRYAELLYRRGRLLCLLGRFDEARGSLLAALREDVCPLRMLPSMRVTLEEVAAELDVPVVDFAKRIEDKCREVNGHALPGEDFFLDHVHPTIDTHRMLGEMLFEYMMAAGVVPASPPWNEHTIESVTQQIVGSLSERDRALAQSTLGRVLRWAGKDVEADRLIAAAIEKVPDDASTVSAYANSLRRAGKTDKAIAHYRRALELEPGLVEAAVNLAVLLVKKGQYDEAINWYGLVLKERPGDGRTMGRLGVALTEARRFGEAEAAFLQAIRLDPENPTIYINYAELLIKQSRFDEALAQFDIALQIHPGAVRAWVLRGVTLARQGRLSDAVENYKEALRLDPSSAQAHYNLGVAYLATGDEDRAIEHFQRAIESDPQLADAHFNLGQVLARRGDHDQARAHFEQVITLAPHDAAAHFHLAMVFLVDEHYAECVGALRRGALAAPDDINILERLAWVLATAPDDAVRDGAVAVALAERVTKLVGKPHVRALDTLAAAYAEAARFEDAVATIGQAIKLAEEEGDEASAVRLRRRLDLYKQNRTFRIGKD